MGFDKITKKAEEFKKIGIKRANKLRGKKMQRTQQKQVVAKI